ncbi:MAG TPA: glycosyltransferase family 39 protein, partial [Ktedonobacterales bacterium]|nr:glycosyltransferase family 39 protein [Ktedonobacterales bacterium]
MTELTAPTGHAPVTTPAAGRALDRARAALRVPRYWALAAILTLAAGADFYQLQREGFANLYYAAAIRSMLQSWHNFFFNAFDPGGFVSVDKPPLGFWVQVASAKLFGYSGFSILLPEALAGVASVGVLYLVVRRYFGTAPGLLAALFLAITPISIVTNRNNTIDSLLVLTVLLAAYAVSRAAEAGRLRWLLLGAVLVGLGFNIKMLEAYLVVPALGALYLFGAPLGWWRRLWHLLLAGVVLVALSLSWLLAVDLTPANLRPYVGSSGSNSELALVLGYNGIQRLLGQIFRIQANVARATANATGPLGPGGVSENGAQGVFRLLNAQLGGQASWLLALGILGMLATGWGLAPRAFVRALPERFRAWRASAGERRAARLAPTASALALWGLWTLTMVVFFSVAGFYHRYYLSMLAPGIAALAGIGVVLLWRDYRATHSSGWRGWLLPLALVATAMTQGVILTSYADWSRWMTPLVVVATLVAAGALVWLRIAAIRQQNAQLAEPIPSALLALPEADEPGTLVVESLPPESPTRPASRSNRSFAWRAWAVAPLLAVSLGVAALLAGP